MNHEDKRPIIAIDFDGTLVTNDFPAIGEIKPDVVEWVREQNERGATIILFTTRQNKKLREARDFCESNNIPIDYYNENPDWLPFETSGKVFADLYVDDRAKNPFGEIEEELVEFASDKEITNG